ncbi:MAG: hypothetical protein QW039_06340 [Fervidicoccaceae archaeon]
MLSKELMNCPRCHTTMEFSMETETFGNGMKKVSTYYKCPVCSYRIHDMSMEIHKYNGSAKIILSRIP